ncbi:Hypothetical_protein [Hexamita inflata]|uniref:Hypothetical_protein n=1 Tax=Hexamita inflata TaxID=28002 RepID=A0AA86NRJ4_9EUKA|nr:Hypothetical protein HINF_LOCUS12253 [Hexamita inflata]
MTTFFVYNLMGYHQIPALKFIAPQICQHVGQRTSVRIQYLLALLWVNTLRTMGFNEHFEILKLWIDQKLDLQLQSQSQKVASDPLMKRQEVEITQIQLLYMNKIRVGKYQRKIEIYKNRKFDRSIPREPLSCSIYYNI